MFFILFQIVARSLGSFDPQDDLYRCYHRQRYRLKAISEVPEIDICEVVVVPQWQTSEANSTKKAFTTA